MASLDWQIQLCTKFVVEVGQVSHWWEINKAIPREMHTPIDVKRTRKIRRDGRGEDSMTC